MCRFQYVLIVVVRYLSSSSVNEISFTYDALMAHPVCTTGLKTIKSVLTDGLKAQFLTDLVVISAKVDLGKGLRINSSNTH